MTDTSFTRRSMLRAASATAALAAVPTTATAQSDETWTAVESPTGNTLYDVEYTAAGAYAVGAGGVVLERTDEGWQKVLDGGPTGNGNSLYGADVTDAGGRLWFVGASGAIGEFDVNAGVVTDHSAPNDVTNNFNDVSTTGFVDEANVYVAGDSGKIYYSFADGETGSWNSVTPGSGAAINAIDFYDTRAGHAVDGNKTVHVSGDGSTWDRLGIENANVNFYGVDSDSANDVTVSAGGGMIHNWDGSSWIPQDTGDATLRDIEVRDTTGLTVGGGGVIYRRDSEGWTQETTPTGQNLKAVVSGEPEIAVGAGGTILER